MEGKANREAGFPGDSISFEVAPDPGCAEGEIVWSGGGDPATGRGRRFETTFSAGGTFEVTARCGDSSRQFSVTICPIDEWLTRARDFYGPSIDFARVHVRGSRVVFGPPRTGWTCNNVIRFKRPRLAEHLPSESTYIHELGHVWEHQTGQAQVLKGIVEQVGKLLGRDPYDFGGPEGVTRATILTGFSKESQAQIVMEYWKSQHGYDADGKGVSFSTPGYVDELRRLVLGAGIGTVSRRRRTLGSSIDSVLARLVNTILAPVE
jgi:hypothetical protein